jgi:hypothetical protein
MRSTSAPISCALGWFQLAGFPAASNFGIFRILPVLWSSRPFSFIVGNGRWSGNPTIVGFSRMASGAED